MKFSGASRFFDKSAVYDAYSNALLFKAQFSAFNDANAIGSTSTRRILSAAPTVTIPTHRCVKIYDDIWIIGDGNIDDWRGKPVRLSHNMRKANRQLSSYLPGAFLTAGAALWSDQFAHADQFKDTVDSMTTGDYFNFWNIYIAPSLQANTGLLLKDSAGTLYRIRNLYLPVEDLRICECDELRNSQVTAVFAGTGKDLVTELPTNPGFTSQAFMLKYSQQYSRELPENNSQLAGDATLLVPQTAGSIAKGQRLTIGQRDFQVIAMAEELDCYSLQIRGISG